MSRKGDLTPVVQEEIIVDAAQNTEKSVENADDKPRRGRPPKESPDRCQYIFTEMKENTVIVRRDDGVEWQEKRMYPVDITCDNPADGINGFCKRHSYPIVQATSKVIPHRTSVIRKTSDGRHCSEEKVENKTTIFQVGENLPVEYFTDEEITELFKSGFIGKRISMKEVASRRSLKRLFDNEIDFLLNLNTEEELAQKILTENYDETTMMAIAKRANSTIVYEACKKALK